MSTPWTVLAPRGEPQTAPKRSLVGVSRDLEGVALGSPGATLHTTLQRVEHLTVLTEMVWRRLAGRGVPVHAYGVGLTGRHDLTAVDGLHLHELDPAEQLVREWNVLVVARDGSAGLAAEEVPLTDADPAAYAGGAALPDGERPFRWVTSEQADDVRAAVETLCRLAH